MSSSVVVDPSWSRLGGVSPSALADARLQLHHAVQIAVSAAISYVPARSDDSHTALTWIESTGSLATEPFVATRAFRVGMRVADLTLHLIDEAGGTASTSFAICGRTIADANAWLRDVIAGVGFDAGRFRSSKHYTIPDHEVVHGVAFSVGIGRELTELSRYWSNAARLLGQVAGDTPNASAVRTWPHHFDIATLIELPGAPRRTIGVGHSPGDDSYAEPYWYVGPNPYPPTHDLPALSGGGHWHTTGWTGAALPASAYVESRDQRGQVSSFVASAVAACRTLLGES